MLVQTWWFVCGLHAKILVHFNSWHIVYSLWRCRRAGKRVTTLLHSHTDDGFLAGRAGKISRKIKRNEMETTLPSSTLCCITPHVTFARVLGCIVDQGRTKKTTKRELKVGTVVCAGCIRGVGTDDQTRENKAEIICKCSIDWCQAQPRACFFLDFGGWYIRRLCLQRKQNPGTEKTKLIEVK